MKINTTTDDNGEKLQFICDCGNELGVMHVQKEVCGCLEGDVFGIHKEFHLEMSFCIVCPTCKQVIDMCKY